MLVVTRWSCSSILEERRTKRRHCVNFSPAVCIVSDMPSDFFTARLPSVCFCLAPGPGVQSSSIQSWTYEQPSCSTCLPLHLSPPPPVFPSIAGSSHTLSLTLETLHTFGSGFFCHVCEQRDISACVCEWVCSFRFTAWLCWRMYHRCSLGEELCCCALAVLCCRVG